MTTIEKLKQALKEYDKHPPKSDWEKGYVACMMTALNIAEAENHSDWIPVSQPPEKNGAYQVTIETCDGKRFVGGANYYGFWQCNSIMKVVAWQPLPEPYKGE